MPDAAPANVTLRRLQRWMSAVVQHPRAAAHAIDASSARTQIAPAAVRRGQVIAPAHNATLFQRVDVYGGAYLARLIEALEGDHRGLRFALGHADFGKLIARYVQRHPSRHPNLNRFGKDLPAFIARQSSLPHRLFLRELARLEVTMSLAFDAPEFVPLDASTLPQQSPTDWVHAVLRPNPSLHLLRLRYPANRYLQAVLDDASPRVPRAGLECVAVYRQAGRVWRMTVPAPMAKVLDRLIAGVAIGHALEVRGQQPEDVARWFGEWSGSGFFVAVESPALTSCASSPPRSRRRSRRPGS